MFGTALVNDLRVLVGRHQCQCLRHHTVQSLRTQTPTDHQHTQHTRRNTQQNDTQRTKTKGPYEGGTWKLHVELPESYPYKSPSIGFVNRIFHPNVDEAAGSVCLDVINQTWSPMFDLVNVFDVFLPQLLLYPNPTDPLNGEAAALMMRNPSQYAQRIRDCVAKYAQNVALHDESEDAGEDEDGDEDEDEE